MEDDFFRNAFRDEFPRLYWQDQFIRLLGLQSSSQLHTFIEKSLRNSRDPVTGLAVRREWFIALKNGLCRLHPELTQWESLRLDELSMVVGRFEPNIKAWVALGDLAYVSLLNHFRGHSGGDEYLQSVGMVFRATEKIPYDLPGRLGGDEFVLMCLRQYAEVVKKTCGQIEDGVALIPLGISGINLPSHIDIGLANFSQAFGVFRANVEHLWREREAYPQGGRVKELVNILVNLADRRSDATKVYGRVRLLVDLILSDPLAFDKCFAFLSKGGGNISREDVIALARLKRASPADYEDAVVKRALAPKATNSFLEARIEEVALAPLRQAFGIA